MAADNSGGNTKSECRSRGTDVYFSGRLTSGHLCFGLLAEYFNLRTTKL